MNVNNNNFVDCLSRAAPLYWPKKEQNQYIVLENAVFKVSASRANKLGTKQIIEFANRTLNDLLVSNANPIDNKIDTLKKLDDALKNYCNRISSWTKSRWWFCILKCFGYPQCPKKLIKVREAVQNAIAQFEKSLPVTEIVTPPKTELPSSTTTPLPPGKNNSQTGKKLLETTDMIKLACSYLSAKDLGSFACISKRGKELQSLLIDDLKRELGFTDIEEEIAQAEGIPALKRMIAEKHKPFDEKTFLKERLCARIPSASYQIPDNDPNDPRDIYIVRIPDHYEFCTENDVEKLRDLFLNYWRATPEEIQNFKADPSENSLYRFLLKKWGFSDEEIQSASSVENKNGLKKLINETIEAERCVKLCESIPDIPLKTIMETHFSDLLKAEPALITRMETYNFLDQTIEGIRIIGGKTLLSVAQHIRDFMRSPSGQKITELRLNIKSLDALPMSINLLKGLKKFYVFGNHLPLLKKLPLLSLPNLKKLCLTEVEFSESTWFNLPELTDFIMSDSVNMQKVPNILGDLRKLTCLEFVGIWSKAIKTWDENTQLPPNLNNLIIENAQFDRLPKSIGQLTSLNELWIGFNSESHIELPEEFAQLTNLSILAFRDTIIDKGQDTLLKLQNLKSTQIHKKTHTTLSKKGFKAPLKHIWGSMRVG